MIQRRARWVVAVALCSAMIAGTTKPASAAFVADFTGNTTFGTELLPSFANFAVYESPTGNWATELNLSSVIGTQDGSFSVEPARFVYFYQLVNNGPLDIEEFRIPLTPGTIPGRSSGVLVNTVFQDDQGPVGPVDNPFLGVSAGSTGFANVGFHTFDPPPLLLQNSHNSIIANANNEMVVQFDLPAPLELVIEGEPVLFAHFSSVNFFTSDMPFTIFSSATAESFTGAQTTGINVPAPHIPEPGSLALLGLGLTVMGGGAAIRKRRPQGGEAGSPETSNPPQAAA